MRRLLAVFVVCGTLAACARNIPQIPVQGEIPGLPIRTTVDSDIAKYFLEHYLKGERVRLELDTTIEAIERDIGIKMPSRSLLKSIAKNQPIWLH